MVFMNTVKYIMLFSEAALDTHHSTIRGSFSSTDREESISIG